MVEAQTERPAVRCSNCDCTPEFWCSKLRKFEVGEVGMDLFDLFWFLIWIFYTKTFTFKVINIRDCRSYLDSSNQVFHSLNISRFHWPQTLHQESHNFLTQLNGVRIFPPIGESWFHFKCHSFSHIFMLYPLFCKDNFRDNHLDSFYFNSPTKQQAPLFFCAMRKKREVRNASVACRSRRCHSSVTGIPEGLIVPSHDLKGKMIIRVPWCHSHGQLQKHPGWNISENIGVMKNVHFCL